MNLDLNLTNRDTLFASLPGGGIGAEIGVDWGEFSLKILEASEPKLLYLIDCWVEQSAGVVGNDPANSQHDIKYHQCLERFLLNDRVRIVKVFSLDIAPIFPDSFFDWVYIDANHMQAYLDEVAWWPKVKTGGLLMGHDYTPVGAVDFCTVKTDIDRFVTEYGLPLLTTQDPIWKNWIIQKV